MSAGLGRALQSRRGQILLFCCPRLSDSQLCCLASFDERTLGRRGSIGAWRDYFLGSADFGRRCNSKVRQAARAPDRGAFDRVSSATSQAAPSPLPGLGRMDRRGDKGVLVLQRSGGLVPGGAERIGRQLVEKSFARRVAGGAVARATAELSGEIGMKLQLTISIAPMRGTL